MSIVEGSGGPTTATWSWRSGTNAIEQRLRVGESLDEVNAECPAPHNCVLKTTISPFYANTDYSVPVTGLKPLTTYYFRIATFSSSSCVANSVTTYTTPANQQLSGTVFLDETNNCSPTAPVWNLGGLTVVASNPGSYSTPVASNGTYTIIPGDDASYASLSLTGIPSGYTCATGPGCPVCPDLGSVANPSSNNNFFLTSSRESWWQAEGAGIYVGGTGGVRSILPSSSYRLILSPLGAGTEGLLITSDGSVDLGQGSVSDSLWMARSLYRGRKMDYNYFSARMGVVRGQDSDWFSDTLDLPGDDEGRDFWYISPTSGTAYIEDPITVSGGDKYVIFVNGDLDISSNIVVNPGSFLAFIVRGDVRVDAAVTGIQGLYVMDNSFVTRSVYVEDSVSDIPLEVQGTVVSWGSLSLGRDMGDDNLSGPAEKFVYRPDLLINMPEAMKTFLMQWQEVAPGSLGN